ncbi:MAG: hypothetical protein ACYCQJ_04030 [Nitrososphaerales archaeon]
MSEITPVQNVTTPKQSSEFRKVYEWSSQNTAEARQGEPYKYFWPSQAKVLLESLKLSKGQLVALVGVSGVGKSSAQREIAKKLAQELPEEKVIHFKWPGKFEASISEIADTLESYKLINREQAYLTAILNKAKSDPEYASQVWTNMTNIKDVDLELLKAKIEQRKFTLDAFIKRYLKVKEKEQVEKNLVLETFANCHSILIDMRDYGINDKRAMMNDLQEIQALWQTIINKTNQVPPNFVFVIQKELAMSQGTVTHFFLGKSRIIELAPFSPGELVEYYKQEFGSIYPFDKEGNLKVLANFSRGIFRRFLRYIKLALEGAVKESNSSEAINVNKDAISRTLDSDELAADWKLDLQVIFPNPRLAAIALDILSILIPIASEEEGGPPIYQSTLINKIETQYEEQLGAADASRILSKLEDYGYIKRKRDGNGKLVYANI